MKIIIIIVLGVVIGIIIILFIRWLLNPSGPVVSGICGLITRTVRKDYCSGSCTLAGSVCLTKTTKPWAVFGTQAASCQCAYVILPNGTSWVNPGGSETPDINSFPSGTEIVYIDDSGKCKEMCLSIKVAIGDNGNPVIDDDRVRRVIDGINAIWGCNERGQCCIRFTIAEIQHVILKRNIDPFSPDLDAALGVARSATCYNFYFGDMMPDTTPGITRFNSGNDGCLVRTKGYPNDTTLITIGAHELGHALGLARTKDNADDTGIIHHSNHPNNLMGPTANLQVELNKMQCMKARMSPLLKDTADNCAGMPKEN